MSFRRSFVLVFSLFRGGWPVILLLFLWCCCGNEASLVVLAHCGALRLRIGHFIHRVLQGKFLWNGIVVK